MTAPVVQEESAQEPPRKGVLIQIGSLRISVQALVVAIAGIVFSMAMSYIIGIMIPYGYIVGLFLLPVFLLAAYSINCMIVGECVVWAWILTVLYVINFLATLVAFTVKMKAIRAKRLQSSNTKANMNANTNTRSNSNAKA